jgi:phosphate transport system substrate-binding protein
MRKASVIPMAAAAAALLAACGGGGNSASSSATTSSSRPAASSSGSSGATTSSVRTGNPPSSVTVTESGSSLLYPFLQELVTPLRSAYANVELQPAAGGSGKGITDATNGITTIGGSDAYLNASELSSGLMNIPIAVSAQDVFYNLPNVKDLKLTGSVLAQMYEGRITAWNNPAIAELNPGVTLPSTKVVTIHRSDSSGDTFLFTGFLSKTDPTWANSVSQNTTVTWPAAPGALTANGNPGMVQACRSVPGCVAYVGISAQSEAQAAGLGEAQLQDKAGQFVTADPTTIGNAVKNSAGNVPSNLVADLLYSGGTDSYPIVNFEYIIVKPTQHDASTALAIRDVLTFATSPTGGSTPALLSKENFQALPGNVLPKVDAAVAKIS